MVLTAAVFPTYEDVRHKLWIFLKSVAKYDITGHLFAYGTGRKFPGYRAMKLDWQLEFLQRSDWAKWGYSHVLYTDSWDAFFTGDLKEIEEKYKSMGSPSILTSAFHQL